MTWSMQNAVRRWRWTWDQKATLPLPHAFLKQNASINWTIVTIRMVYRDHSCRRLLTIKSRLLSDSSNEMGMRNWQLVSFLFQNVKRILFVNSWHTRLYSLSKRTKLNSHRKHSETLMNWLPHYFAQISSVSQWLVRAPVPLTAAVLSQCLYV